MVRLTDCLNMTIAFDLDVKPQAKQNPLSKMVPSVPHSMSLNLTNQTLFFNSVLFLQTWYR